MINDENGGDTPRGSEKKEHGIVRLIKTIVENPRRGKTIDESVVSFRYFNAFNYSVLSRDGKNLNMSLGVTSANRGEGKTLVACNLAASLAMGFQKKTILLDLNFSGPRIHDIFGVSNGPGLADAFTNGSIMVSPTAIDHLYVLGSGVLPLYHEMDGSAHHGGDHHFRTGPKPFLGLEQLTAFRDIIYSLEQEFEFVIADLPSIGTGEIPVLFTNQLNGLLIVVNSGRTRQEEIDAMFQKINEQQVLGFVLNRFS